MLCTYTMIKIQFERVYCSFLSIYYIESWLYRGFLQGFIKQKGTHFIGGSIYRASSIVVKKHFKEQKTLSPLSTRRKGVETLTAKIRYVRQKSHYDGL